MSRLDDLDARSELEQQLATNLRAALQKRGCTVTHNGTATAHAPGGKADIIIEGPANESVLVEATKSKNAAQDREMNSIRDHLDDYKRSNPTRDCYTLFVSPETGRRMIDGIGDHNRQRAAEGKQDQRVMPVAFDVLEMWLDRLTGSPAEFYPLSDLVRLMTQHDQFLDDLRVRKLLVETLFPRDVALLDEVERLEVERDQNTLQSLVKDLARLEDHMRESGVANGPSAIDVLIQLVFLKVYEEKREARGATNRLKNPAAFSKYLADSVDGPTRTEGRGIHRLFKDVSQDEEFVTSGMFDRGETLPDSVTDAFILSKVMPVFEKYLFEGTRVDALGAVYEVLAMRSSKDVKVGQFFTPENVVRFMVGLSGLDYCDRVLDPACGTGRFLIHAMDRMLSLVSASSERDKDNERAEVCRSRLWGADIDVRIARIAKMNMWIHGDGKTNILGGPEANGLTLYKRSLDVSDSGTFEGAFDLVLTNPPLGDLNYQQVAFGAGGETLESGDESTVADVVSRFPFVPHTDLREARVAQLEARVKDHSDGLRAMEAAVSSDPTNTKLSAAVGRKREVVARNKKLLDEARAELMAGQPAYEVTGTTLKGGALFLAAINDYLKHSSRPGELVEWRGGRLVVVLDDSVLNTDGYGATRAFIRKHFYIKAVISLTRDTFVPVSSTTTKTSVLYAIKKGDPSDVQREPIFYANAATVGMDTKGRVCSNDLVDIARDYADFADRVRASYTAGQFDISKFEASLAVDA